MQVNHHHKLVNYWQHCIKDIRLLIRNLATTSNSKFILLHNEKKVAGVLEFRTIWLAFRTNIDETLVIPLIVDLLGYAQQATVRFKLFFSESLIYKMLSTSNHGKKEKSFDIFKCSVAVLEQKYYYLFNFDVQLAYEFWILWILCVPSKLHISRLGCRMDSIKIMIWEHQSLLLLNFVTILTRKMTGVGRNRIKEVV